MARVVSVGAIATVAHMPRGAPDAPPESLSVHLRLFAKTDTGLLAIDPHPQTSNIGTQPSQSAALPEMVKFVLGAAVGGQIPAEHRAAHWGRIVEVLAEQFGISTDPETLMALPFELLPDSELHELIEGGG
jgi:hypothetical protein